MDKVTANLDALIERAATVVNLSEDSSASWREDTWGQAKIEWLKNPFYGVGFGHQILVDTGDWQDFEELRNIHNSPLAIMVQTGLLGIAVLGLFILAVLLSIRKKLFESADLAPYYLGLIGALAVFLISSIFQPYLETNLMGIWLWIILGLLRTATLINNKPVNKELA